MLLELKRSFDVVDASARLEDYPLVILPDQIPVDGALASRLQAISIRAVASSSADRAVSTQVVTL
jgi:hypothetical protein